MRVQKSQNISFLNVVIVAVILEKYVVRKIFIYNYLMASLSVSWQASEFAIGAAGQHSLHEGEHRA